MNSINAEFVTSSTNVEQCPSDNIPEYAFIGRSNVGKSSLINMLVRRKGLAKTSNKPGKTQLINYFKIDGSWFLVDLPGYGYAQVSKSKKNEFKRIITDYISKRGELITLFVLIDCRHSPQKIDLEFIEWLGVNRIPFDIIFTKADKISNSALENNISNFKNEMLKTWEFLPNIFKSSSSSGIGRDEIIEYIREINKKL
ncbi:ribosome biogenesis GTP-binding protein YihA/YsxC [Ichthyobacterium seriolicida]|uniref:Probable GTP-binding protein EngB n=1 Tax=Ichthyobacterium seriolicida TaxID=242600 RepID=A0A1J1E354_9FLAO|nr:ribosome biogenesis GTP-binding protein YihA/YsxC [Ichthyobacterium seriolicida]BAV95405.1 GTP-binding protein YsxC [Ichthyobacterium seriolicida]